MSLSSVWPNRSIHALFVLSSTQLIFSLFVKSILGSYWQQSKQFFAEILPITTTFTIVNKKICNFKHKYKKKGINTFKNKTIPFCDELIDYWYFISLEQLFLIQLFLNFLLFKIDFNRWLSPSKSAHFWKFP